ncbi:transposable element Tcb1 transposase [Trichonephila inaurata madagascariensis]|uniref:Transposable element Tcb1 transposase n=1 Tax=Trichonephila inaurata madagascariensis TaxID=2747483 RepID=A0A8X6X2G8_9ARAC|nr:transposable element Tcb1 transposase [Trichonephila inaurata madagascariensis]
MIVRRCSILLEKPLFISKHLDTWQSGFLQRVDLLYTIHDMSKKGSPIKLHADKPHLTVTLALPETFVEALVDGSAKMPCNVIQRKDDGVEFIFWYKNDGVTALYTLDARDRRLANATHMRNETYSDRVHFHVTGDVPYLQMDYLKEEDTGSYFCRVDYQWSATELKRVNLVVVGKYIY